MMAGQGDLFTELLIPNGEALAQEGMSRAEDNADEGWLRAARLELAALIQAAEPFTTDHIWYRLERLGVHTHEPRALGALIRQAAKAGLIQRISYTPTTRPEAHARPIPVWQATGKKVSAA